MALRKWSITIDQSLAARVEDHVGERGLSCFVAQAVENELERISLRRYLDDLDEQHGPVSQSMVERFDDPWPL